MNLEEEGKHVFLNAELANLVHIMKENFNTYQEQLKLYAKLRMIKYSALVDEGFTAEQAMYVLTKTNLFE